MRVGIVGSEEAKFTEIGKGKAKRLIREILGKRDVTEVVSGGCHLGGIDQWAAEIGERLGRKVTVYLPKRLSWKNGFKDRNLKIVERSDIVYCITVQRLPNHFKGMKFDCCYHCHTKDHVKSGGCWTMRHAIKKGKQGRLLVVRNY